METKPRFFCFTLMPFSEDFDDIYSLGIKTACNSAGAYCERVDEQVFRESILDRIYNQISKADLVIADMSKKNPNVFYEVGYAHALGKPTGLLTQDPNDIPFDMKHFQHIVYNNKISYLKDELSKRVQWYIENPKVDKMNSEFRFDVFMGEHNLLKDKVTFNVSKDQVPLIDFVLHNSSPNTFLPGSFRIGILSPQNYGSCRDKTIETIKLPDNKFMHMLPDLGTLYPDTYAKFILYLNNSPEPNKEAEFIIRIFSAVGKIDYPFYIRKSVGNENFININTG